MSVCERCGAQFQRKQYPKQRFCSRVCWGSVANRKPVRWEAEARQLWAEGLTAVKIAGRFGVTKNVVIGLAHRRGWADKKANGDSPSTMLDRLAELHAKMDAILAECALAPRLSPNEETK